jgi:hypothetical protein
MLPRGSDAEFAARRSDVGRTLVSITFSRTYAEEGPALPMEQSPIRAAILEKEQVDATAQL